MKKQCYIFDIDHTLSYPVNRGPYASCQDDEIIISSNCILEGILMLNSIPKMSVSILILTGRKECAYRDDTLSFLWKNNIRFEKLIMNDTSPCVEGSIFKRVKLEELQKEYNILGVFDDDEDVAKACKELGIPSFLFSYNQ